jgi:hypothetical protein
MTEENKVVPIKKAQAHARAEDAVNLRQAIEAQIKAIAENDQQIAAAQAHNAKMREGLAMQRRLLSYAEEGPAGE